MGLFSRKKKEEERPKPEETASLARLAFARAKRAESRRAGKAVSAGEQEAAATPSAKLPKGEDAESYGVILKPHVTEKGTVLEGKGKYIFRVAKNANKPEIKNAIEKLYRVKVKNVHILKMPSKFRQVGKYEGKRPGFKKAIVTLKEGDRIEINK